MADEPLERPTVLPLSLASLALARAKLPTDHPLSRAAIHNRYNDPQINWAHFSPAGNISMAIPPTNGGPAVPSIVQALLARRPLPPNSNFGCAAADFLLH